MNTPSGEAIPADAAARCETARQHAENGETDQAARIFEEILALGPVPERARAALGLAVVREDAGDVEGARQADRIAIAAGDPEYGPRAAYHLALSYERTGEAALAGAAWRQVVGFANPAYLATAQLALARLADEDGDLDTARDWWEQVVAGGDPRFAAVAAHDLAHRLLAEGETAQAQVLLADALRALDPAADPDGYARLAAAMGMAHLEHAIGAFGAALQTGSAQVAPLVIELLARTLPLRGRADAAAQVWESGLADPAVAEQVRTRLRREFGDTAPEGLWWEPYVESAVGRSALPALTGEVFGALDHLYSLIALRYAEEPAEDAAETRELLGEAVRVPSQYPWGGTLHRSFAQRLQEAMGTSAPVLPDTWPDLP